MGSEITTSMNVSVCEYAVFHVSYKSARRSARAVKLCKRPYCEASNMLCSVSRSNECRTDHLVQRYSG